MSSQLLWQAYGRLAESQALNAVDGPVSTRYRYDAAGRPVGVKVGDAAEQVQGFDAKLRPAYRSDGDQAVWRGRYDAWDRLWLEHQPTGAVVEHFYGRSNRPTQEKIWSGDPQGDSATLLKDTRTSFTSFGAMKRVVEVLTPGENQQVRITEQDFDEAGRVVLVASGPALAGELDRTQARRESQTVYEPLTGRILHQSTGGSIAPAPQGGPEIEQRYRYEASSPWPESIATFERLPDGVNG